MKSSVNENTWDKLLKVKTTGRDDSHSDQFCYPYEPTPYSVLERLANSEIISKKSNVLDYGCGKGRVEFFLAYQTKCHCIGVEYDQRIYASAVENQKSAVSSGRVKFVMEKAEDYSVPERVDCIYFFNPFSLEILRKVITRIKESYFLKPRQILLLFYYPSDEYISYLMTVKELSFWDEIDCRDLFTGNNKREQITIFELN